MHAMLKPGAYAASSYPRTRGRAPPFKGVVAPHPPTTSSSVPRPTLLRRPSVVQALPRGALVPSAAVNASGQHRRVQQSTARQRRRRPAVAAAAAAAAAAGGDVGSLQAAADAPVVIVGAGISGLATAVALHKVGIPVCVLEAAPELRAGGSAIALWANAWRALDVLGVGQALREEYPLLLDRVELVSSGGELLRAFSFSECDAPDKEFRGVLRGRLLQLLADQLPPGALQLGAKVTRVRLEEASGCLELEGGQVLQPQLLIGADGGRSQVAAALGLSPLKYAGYVAYRGVATFPDGLPLPANTVRQILGAGTRAGMYPLSDSTAYWYTCFNAPQDARAPSSPSATQLEALAAVEGWSWGIQEAIRATPLEGLSRSRIGDRWTVGAVGRGGVTLAGDAAHPTTPNLGQGGCMALEDSVVLARAVAGPLSSSGLTPGSQQQELEQALRCYELERSKRCLPVTVRSWAFGAALQLPWPPLVSLRNTVISKYFRPSGFLDHTQFNCGELPAAAAGQGVGAAAVEDQGRTTAHSSSGSS